MGLRSIRMPDVGEGVAEAEIVEWHVAVGDLVREDQPIAAVMTDKATVEIPTPVSGTVVAIGGAVGTVLAVGSELIRIDAPGLPDSSPAPPPRGVAKAAPDGPGREASAPGAAASTPPLAQPAATAGGRDARPSGGSAFPPLREATAVGGDRVDAVADRVGRGHRPRLQKRYCAFSRMR
jgi:2-oxoisovalerate dehydrogenase E2 component (dihydrolipoyl transacylase)